MFMGDSRAWWKAKTGSLENCWTFEYIFLPPQNYNIKGLSKLYRFKVFEHSLCPNHWLIMNIQTKEQPPRKLERHEGRNREEGGRKEGRKIW